MEGGVSDKKDDKSENNDEEKELGCLEETSPDETEYGKSDKRNDKNEKMRRKKRLNA